MREDLAEQLYAVCAATDANYVAPAAFGLARTRADARRPHGQPRRRSISSRRTSGAYIAARRRRAELLTASDARARRRSRRPRRASRTSRSILATGSTSRCGSSPRRSPRWRESATSRLTTIGDVPATDTELRAAAEAGVPRPGDAHLGSRRRAIQLVDAANAIRPRTLV